MVSQPGKATQSFVPLKEIKEGYAILKDGSLRALSWLHQLTLL
jgi:hypothetical protein